MNTWHTKTRRRAFSSGLFLLLTTLLSPAAPWVISANENKISLGNGTQTVVRAAAPDTLTLLDFAVFPPRVQHITNVSNSVLGPPSNVGLTPDGSRALIADSVRFDPAHPDRWLPARRVHVLDLTSTPPRLAGEIETGDQPSGLSISTDGRLALIANRAGGTVTAVRLDGPQPRVLTNVPVCLPKEEASDVAISPDGRTALVSLREAGVVRRLDIDGDRITASDRRFSVYGRPYRVLITPDGALGLSAGMGWGTSTDADALSVMDLQGAQPRTTDYVVLGSAPESIELSPDGQWLLAVMMNGSSLAPGRADHRTFAELVVLRRQGRTFARVQTLPVGPIPEGVAFTPDGRHVVLQCHPERRLWIFAVDAGGLRDTGVRIDVPGMPSGLRASPR